jgi:hypothetical protein
MCINIPINMRRNQILLQVAAILLLVLLQLYVHTQAQQMQQPK